MFKAKLYLDHTEIYICGVWKMNVIKNMF